MSGLFHAVAHLGIQDPCEAVHAKITTLHEFWLSKRDAEGFFRHRDFDVLDLPRHLIAHLYLIKVHEAGNRFEVRLAGEEVNKGYGFNIMGKFIDEIPGTDISQKRMAFCVENNMAYAAEGPMTWGEKDFQNFSLATLPLHNDEGQVSYLLGVTCFYFGAAVESPATQLNIACSNLPPEDLEIFDKAFDFWIRAKGDHKVPLKSHIDITQIPQILPQVMLCEVIADPLDFRVKLVGEKIKAIITPENLGKLFSTQPGKMRGSKIWSFYEAVYETACPRYNQLDYEGPVDNISSVLNLLLPFSEDGQNVSHVMNIVHLKMK
jgi:hypothetical protein